MYSYHTRIPYSSVARNGKISYGAVLDLFQNCSTYQSDDMGVGLEYLLERGKGWIVAYNEIIFNDLSYRKGELTVGTWPYEMKAVFGKRNFILKDEEGSPLAVSDSLWVFMDTVKGRMERVPEEIAKSYATSHGDRYEMKTHDRKIKPPADMEYIKDFPVRLSDVDTNGHTNNAVYVSLAEDLLDEKKEYERLRIEYRRPVMYPGIMKAYLGNAKNNLFIELRNEQDENCVVMEWYPKA